jgi:hypothetical protein
VAAASARAADPVIPLDPKLAKELELLGKGVVGKAGPAPPITDVAKYFHLGAGEWKYDIVHGDDDAKVRVESCERIEGPEGTTAYKRTIGEMFTEYLQIDADGHFGKYAEDDLDVGYGARMDPGVMVHSGIKAGDKVTVKSKLSAFKMGKPDDIKFSGTMTSNLEYVGAYEVTTPAGTWPALLVRNQFLVEIGPAKVNDVAYVFFADGVGKVAEIESLNVSALLVYHSNTKTAKVLTSFPKGKR